MKRIATLMLTLVMLIMLLPVGAAEAETVTKKPFYTINSSALESEFEYVYALPNFWVNGSKLTGESLPISVSGYGSTIPTIASSMKDDMNARPDGARYINFSTLAIAFNNLHEDVIFMDKAATLIAAWLDEFLAEYSSIGGKLDGIIVDLEYNEANYYYIWSLQYRKNNKNIYNEIVESPYYAKRMRPKLVARGFEFLPEGEQGGEKSEIWTIHKEQGISACQSIWNAAIQELMAEYINEAVYNPLKKYYQGAVLSDYHRMDSNSWYKHVSDSGGISSYNHLKVGNTSNYNVTYGARPGKSYYDFTDDGSRRTTYETPPSFNNAVFEPTPFNMAMWDVNLLKRAKASTEGGQINAWISFFNYNPTAMGTISNTPYYSEIILHTGLMDPRPFLGYVHPKEVVNNGEKSDDPKAAIYDYAIRVINELMAELTRLVGTSDRQPIQTPASWNGSYILSGMYAGGRNMWRITPDTTKVSLADFKTNDKTPTFFVDGLTITFPQGKIITDSKISAVGTCGYWVETPANVTPVITSTADRYENNPAFAETFETYKTGEFTTASVYPNTYWAVDGAAEIRENAGSKVLALSGDASIINKLIPQNVTAGDEFAKQQAWEVKVTLPADSYGDVLLFSCGDNDGVKISGGKAYGYDVDGKLHEICSLGAGVYTVKRISDFTNPDSHAADYAIYDAKGNLLGEVKDLPTAACAVVGMTITMSVSGAAKAVLLDDYKLYPIGVTTILEQYDTVYGQKLTDASERTADTAYRLSWLNGSQQYKRARIYDAKTGATIETVDMAPGMDGVAVGVVKASADKPILISVEVQNVAMPSVPDNDIPEDVTDATEESAGALESTGAVGDGDTPGTLPGNSGVATPDLEPQADKGISVGLIVLLVILGVAVLAGGSFAVFVLAVKPKLTEESPSWLLKLSAMITKKSIDSEPEPRKDL